jgi:pimeloyl-ACP methyl ester carboxylesterase
LAEIHFLIFYDKINHRVAIDSTLLRQGIVDYLTSSTRQSVVLLHGLAASHHDWDWLKPELLQAGYRVISPDLPGHGVNPGPDDPDQFHIEAIYTGLTNWITREKD